MTSTGAITTVLGPIRPEESGVSLTHEHILIDMQCYWREPDEAGDRLIAESDVTIDKLGLLRRNPTLMRDNLVLDDLDLGIKELLEFRKLGGATLVEVTPPDAGRDPRALQVASRTTGLQVVAGCGHYVNAAHPPTLHDESVDEIADRLLREALEGIDDTGIRPGIIGELGTSAPLHPDEEKVLRAAARVQAQTGLAITLHLDPPAAAGLEILDILESEGANPARVVMGHLDATIESSLDYHKKIIERGCYVQYDGCGNENYWPGGLGPGSSFWLPLDQTRIRAIKYAFDHGYQDQLLISQDVCKKMDLMKYGGFGYGHIVRNMVPQLRDEGFDQGEIDQLLIDNPRTMLTH
jgi:phosphotriesterase-related protein